MLKFSFVSHILWIEYPSTLQVHLLWTRHFCKVNFWVLILKITRLYKWVFPILFHMNVRHKKSPHELSPNCYTFKNNITNNRQKIMRWLQMVNLSKYEFQSSCEPQFNNWLHGRPMTDRTCLKFSNKKLLSATIIT